MSRTTVATDKILDGTIVNADVDAAAAIAGTKISPNFGAQDLIVNTSDLVVDHTNHRVGVGTASTQAGYSLTVGGAAYLINTGASSDVGMKITDANRSWKVGINVAGSSGAGIYSIYDATAGQHRLSIDTNGKVGIKTTGPNNELTVSGSVDISGSLSIGASSANASAILDISSTSKGVLLPRMTAAQIAAISTPATGLLVYQTDGATPGYFYYNGSSWVEIAIGTLAYEQGGNSFGADGVLGVNDAHDLYFRAGGSNWMRLSQYGRLYVGGTPGGDPGLPGTPFMLYLKENGTANASLGIEGMTNGATLILRSGTTVPSIIAWQGDTAPDGAFKWIMGTSSVLSGTDFEINDGSNVRLQIGHSDGRVTVGADLKVSGFVGLGSQSPSSGSNRIMMADGDRLAWASGSNIAGSATNTVINTATGSAGALLVNFGANSGTGGMVVYGGGSSPVAKFRVDPAGASSYVMGQFGVNSPPIGSTTRALYVEKATTSNPSAGDGFVRFADSANAIGIEIGGAYNTGATYIQSANEFWGSKKPLVLQPVGGSVGIGNGNAAPAASALLDMVSTTQGLLTPRMTTTQKNAISSPATGLLVFDTSLGQFSAYNGSTWTSVGGGQQIKYNGSLEPAETYLNFTGGGVTVTDTPGSNETTVTIGGGVETRQSFVATAGQTAFTLSVAYTLGGVNLQVYRNGMLQKLGASYDYVETSTTVITFNNALVAGESVECVYRSLTTSILNVAAGTERRQAFTATGGSQTFTLSNAYVNNGTNLRVYVNGMLQKPSTNYSEDNTTQFTIASGLTAGDVVEAIWTSAATGVVSYTPSTEVRQDFAGDGSTVTFTLTGGATFIQGGTNLRVYVDGVLMRMGASYDYTEPANNQITFGTAPASGQTVTMICLSQAGAIGSVKNQRKEAVATSGQTTFDVGFTFIMGGADLLVYNDGVLMKLGEDYYELNNASVVFYTGRVASSKVTFIGKSQLAAGDANSVNGIAASATPTASKLLPLDSAAQVPMAALQRAIQSSMIFGR